MPRFFLVIIILLTCPVLRGQNKYIDNNTQHLFDSLDSRISYLRSEIPKLTKTYDVKLFSTKRELDMTIFVRHYEELIFDEDLETANKLIDEQIAASEKRADKYAADFYKSYKTKLTRLRGEKRTYYQQLFAKEKNFKKEFEKFTKVGDEYSLTRAIRMVKLAKKYAEDKNMQQTLTFLKKYENYAYALVYDLHSDYDLKKLTKSEKYFFKIFEPMIESDSLNTVKEASNLVKQCYNYSIGANSKLDTTFFSKQLNVAANAISDWSQRQGFIAELSSLTDQAVIARLDTVNRVGIYKWRNMVLVIGTVKFNSKSENVRRGEAIIDSDETLLNYIKINRLYTKNSKNAKVGKSYMVPYILDGKKSYFIFDPKSKEYQYMICYVDVIDKNITLKLNQFLPPLQFREEIQK